MQRAAERVENKPQYFQGHSPEQGLIVSLLAKYHR